MNTLPTAQTADTSIAVGDRVRSYDFPGTRDDCYVEGVVVTVGSKLDGCDRYEIEVERQVIEGIDVDDFATFVYPPVNGTPSWLGGVTFGVVKL